MRRLLTLQCEGEAVGATIDEAPGEIGVLIVTGGSQTRIGSHRLFERLAVGLAEAGHASLRFDRRGIGDSSGADPGFRQCGPDIAAAAAALRAEAPSVRRVIGLGLCDGASALALHGAAGGVDGAILVNPWLVEAQADAPPPAAIRSHYRRQLTSVAGWKKIATGAVSYRKLFAGVAKVAASRTHSALANEVAAALRRDRRPSVLILASGDATAIAAAAEVKAGEFAGLIDATYAIDTDSHTFARPGDVDALLAAVIEALSSSVIPAKAGISGSGGAPVA